MFYLKYYKPLIKIKLMVKFKNTNIKIFNNKIKKILIFLNNINNVFYISNKKICFFSFKYKTQLNILHQSRFKLRHDLNFNKNQSWSKFQH